MAEDVIEKEKGLIERARDNITSLVSIIAGITVFISTFLYIDERYAHAEEIRQLETNVNVNNARLRVDLIDDKIFYLEQKANKTDQDEATLKRLERQREDATKEVDQLRKGIQ